MTTNASDGKEAGTLRLLRSLGRALLLRCPHCGGAPLFRRWMQIHAQCRACGLKTDRGQADYFIGGYLVNLIVAELLVVAGMVAVAFWTWPDVPWDLLTWGLVAAMVPAPFLTYPYAKACWLAMDLVFQPVTEDDFGPVAGRQGPGPGLCGAACRGH